MAPINVSTDDIKILLQKKSEKLGEGAFGTVYSCCDVSEMNNPALRTKLAIKQSKGNSAYHKSQYTEELEILSKFQHKNIIKLIGYGETKSSFILAYELMKGSIADALEDIDWAVTLEIINGVASALHYLHGLSPAIVHMDLKPENILLDEEKNAKICDFGAARTVGEKIVQFTEAYAAPEIHNEERDKTRS